MSWIEAFWLLFLSDVVGMSVAALLGFLAGLWLGYRLGKK